MLPLPKGAVWQALLVLCLALLVREARAEVRVVCYYTNWSVYRPGTAKFNPQNINPYLCTHLIYAFGGFTKDNTLKPFDKYQDIEQGGYAKFTGLKSYNKQLKTMLAIGGWNEASSRFSPLVANPERRQQFIRNILKFLRQNHFDGLDLDWEYPAFRDGGKPRDRDNYAKFVEELRSEFDRESQKTGRPRLLLTMAVPAGIEYIEKGYDIPKLNQYLDWFNILSYDYHSAFEPSVNHHAPLYSLEEASEYNYDAELNIDYTVKFYVEAGADRDKLVLGIPTYGRSYTLINEDDTAIGAPADGPGEQGDATREKGYLAYYEICQSIRDDDSWEVVHPNENAMGPYAHRGNQWVGYDDENIARKKAQYVAENGLGGIMFWSLDNDDFRGACSGKPYPLIEAAKEALLDALGSGANEITAPARTKTQSRQRSRAGSSSSTRNRVSEQGTAGKGTNSSSKQSSSSRRKSNKKKSSTTVRTTSTTTEGSLYIGGRTTTPAPPTTPDPGADFKCEEEGFFAHPRDCKKYFWCLDSGPSNLGIVAHQFTCPSGLYFNTAADSCDFSRNVLCKKSNKDSTTTTNTPLATTAKTTTTTTTTSAPYRITAATSSYSFIQRTTTTASPIEDEEEEYEDEEPEIENGSNHEEDPKVIKELIDLIKRVGGLEELEKQLHIQEDGTVVMTSSKSDQVSTTPSSISQSLYAKVLSRPNPLSALRNRLGGTKFTTKKEEVPSSSSGTSGTDSSSNTKSTSYRNSRPSPQNAGIDKLPEFEGFLKEKPKYVTINRTRPTKQEDEEPEEEAIAEDVDDDETIEDSSEATRKRTSSSYVSIQRSRPTKSPASISSAETDDDDRSLISGNSNTKYQSINRVRSSTTEANEEDIAEVDNVQSSKSASTYQTLTRAGGSTEGTFDSELEQNQASTKTRPPRPTYQSFTRTRATTISEENESEPKTEVEELVSAKQNYQSLSRFRTTTQPNIEGQAEKEEQSTRNNRVRPTISFNQQPGNTRGPTLALAAEDTKLDAETAQKKNRYSLFSRRQSTVAEEEDEDKQDLSATESSVKRTRGTTLASSIVSQEVTPKSLDSTNRLRNYERSKFTATAGVTGTESTVQPQKDDFISSVTVQYSESNLAQTTPIPAQEQNILSATPDYTNIVRRSSTTLLPITAISSVTSQPETAPLDVHNVVPDSPPQNTFLNEVSTSSDPVAATPTLDSVSSTEILANSIPNNSPVQNEIQTQDVNLLTESTASGLDTIEVVSGLVSALNSVAPSETRQETTTKTKAATQEVPLAGQENNLAVGSEGSVGELELTKTELNSESSPNTVNINSSLSSNVDSSDSVLIITKTTSTTTSRPPSTSAPASAASRATKQPTQSTNRFSTRRRTTTSTTTTTEEPEEFISILSSPRPFSLTSRRRTRPPLTRTTSTTETFLENDTSEVTSRSRPTSATKVSQISSSLSALNVPNVASKNLKSRTGILSRKPNFNRSSDLVESNSTLVNNPTNVPYVTVVGNTINNFISKANITDTNSEFRSQVKSKAKPQNNEGKHQNNILKQQYPESQGSSNHAASNSWHDKTRGSFRPWRTTPSVPTSQLFLDRPYRPGFASSDSYLQPNEEQSYENYVVFSGQRKPGVQSNSFGSLDTSKNIEKRPSASATPFEANQQNSKEHEMSRNGLPIQKLKSEFASVIEEANSTEYKVKEDEEAIKSSDSSQFFSTQVEDLAFSELNTSHNFDHSGVENVNEDKHNYSNGVSDHADSNSRFGDGKEKLVFHRTNNVSKPATSASNFFQSRTQSQRASFLTTPDSKILTFAPRTPQSQSASTLSYQTLHPSFQLNSISSFERNGARLPLNELLIAQKATSTRQPILRNRGHAHLSTTTQKPHLTTELLYRPHRPEYLTDLSSLLSADLDKWQVSHKDSKVRKMVVHRRPSAEREYDEEFEDHMGSSSNIAQSNVYLATNKHERIFAGGRRPLSIDQKEQIVNYDDNLNSFEKPVEEEVPYERKDGKSNFVYTMREVGSDGLTSDRNVDDSSQKTIHMYQLTKVNQTNTLEEEEQNRDTNGKENSYDVETVLSSEMNQKELNTNIQPTMEYEMDSQSSNEHIGVTEIISSIKNNLPSTPATRASKSLNSQNMADASNHVTEFPIQTNPINSNYVVQYNTNENANEVKITTDSNQRETTNLPDEMNLEENTDIHQSVSASHVTYTPENVIRHKVPENESASNNVSQEQNTVSPPATVDEDISDSEGSSSEFEIVTKRNELLQNSIFLKNNQVGFNNIFDASQTIQSFTAKKSSANTDFESSFATKDAKTTPSGLPLLHVTTGHVPQIPLSTEFTTLPSPLVKVAYYFAEFPKSLDASDILGENVTPAMSSGSNEGLESISPGKLKDILGANGIVMERGDLTRVAYQSPSVDFHARKEIDTHHEQVESKIVKKYVIDESVLLSLGAPKTSLPTLSSAFNQSEANTSANLQVSVLSQPSNGDLPKQTDPKTSQSDLSPYISGAYPSVPPDYIDDNYEGQIYTQPILPTTSSITSSNFRTEISPSPSSQTGGGIISSAPNNIYSSKMHEQFSSTSNIALKAQDNIPSRQLTPAVTSTEKPFDVDLPLFIRENTHRQNIDNTEAEIPTDSTIIVITNLVKAQIPHPSVKDTDEKTSLPEGLISLQEINQQSATNESIEVIRGVPSKLINAHTLGTIPVVVDITAPSAPDMETAERLQMPVNEHTNRTTNILSQKPLSIATNLLTESSNDEHEEERRHIVVKNLGNYHSNAFSQQSVDSASSDAFASSANSNLKILQNKNDALSKTSDFLRNESYNNLETTTEVFDSSQNTLTPQNSEEIQLAIETRNGAAIDSKLQESPEAIPSDKIFETEASQTERAQFVDFGEELMAPDEQVYEEYSRDDEASVHQAPVDLAQLLSTHSDTSVPLSATTEMPNDASDTPSVPTEVPVTESLADDSVVIFEVKYTTPAPELKKDAAAPTEQPSFSTTTGIPTTFTLTGKIGTTEIPLVEPISTVLPSISTTGTEISSSQEVRNIINGLVQLKELVVERIEEAYDISGSQSAESQFDVGTSTAAPTASTISFEPDQTTPPEDHNMGIGQTRLPEVKEETIALSTLPTATTANTAPPTIMYREESSVDWATLVNDLTTVAPETSTSLSTVEYNPFGLSSTNQIPGIERTTRSSSEQTLESTTSIQSVENQLNPTELTITQPETIPTTESVYSEGRTTVLNVQNYSTHTQYGGSDKTSSRLREDATVRSQGRNRSREDSRGRIQPLIHRGRNKFRQTSSESIETTSAAITERNDEQPQPMSMTTSGSTSGESFDGEMFSDEVEAYTQTYGNDVIFLTKSLGKEIKTTEQNALHPALETTSDPVQIDTTLRPVDYSEDGLLVERSSTEQTIPSLELNSEFEKESITTTDILTPQVTKGTQTTVDVANNVGAATQINDLAAHLQTVDLPLESDASVDMHPRHLSFPVRTTPDSYVAATFSSTDLSNDAQKNISEKQGVTTEQTILTLTEVALLESTIPEMEPTIAFEKKINEMVTNTQNIVGIKTTESDISSTAETTNISEFSTVNLGMSTEQIFTFSQTVAQSPEAERSEDETTETIFPTATTRILATDDPNFVGSFGKVLYQETSEQPSTGTEDALSSFDASFTESSMTTMTQSPPPNDVNFGQTSFNLTVAGESNENMAAENFAQTTVGSLQNIYSDTTQNMEDIPWTSTVSYNATETTDISLNMNTQNELSGMTTEPQVSLPIEVNMPEAEVQVQESFSNSSMDVANVKHSISGKTTQVEPALVTVMSPVQNLEESLRPSVAAPGLQDQSRNIQENQEHIQPNEQAFTTSDPVLAGQNFSMPIDEAYDGEPINIDDFFGLNQKSKPNDQEPINIEDYFKSISTIATNSNKQETTSRIMIETTTSRVKEESTFSGEIVVDSLPVEIDQQIQHIQSTSPSVSSLPKQPTITFAPSPNEQQVSDDNNSTKKPVVQAVENDYLLYNPTTLTTVSSQIELSSEAAKLEIPTSATFADRNVSQNKHTRVQNTTAATFVTTPAISMSKPTPSMDVAQADQEAIRYFEKKYEQVKYIGESEQHDDVSSEADDEKTSQTNATVAILSPKLSTNAPVIATVTSKFKALTDLTSTPSSLVTQPPVSIQSTTPMRSLQTELTTEPITITPMATTTTFTTAKTSTTSSLPPITTSTTSKQLPVEERTETTIANLVEISTSPTSIPATIRSRGNLRARVSTPLSKFSTLASRRNRPFTPASRSRLSKTTATTEAPGIDITENTTPTTRIIIRTTSSSFRSRLNRFQSRTTTTAAPDDATEEAQIEVTEAPKRTFISQRARLPTTLAKEPKIGTTSVPRRTFISQRARQPVRSQTSTSKAVNSENSAATTELPKRTIVSHRARQRTTKPPSSRSLPPGISRQRPDFRLRGRATTKAPTPILTTTSEKPNYPENFDFEQLTPSNNDESTSTQAMVIAVSEATVVSASPETMEEIEKLSTAASPPMSSESPSIVDESLVNEDSLNTSRNANGDSEARDDSVGSISPPTPDTVSVLITETTSEKIISTQVPATTRPRKVVKRPIFIRKPFPSRDTNEQTTTVQAQISDGNEENILLKSHVQVNKEIVVPEQNNNIQEAEDTETEKIQEKQERPRRPGQKNRRKGSKKQAQGKRKQELVTNDENDSSVPNRRPKNERKNGRNRSKPISQSRANPQPQKTTSKPESPPSKPPSDNREHVFSIPRKRFQSRTAASRFQVPSEPAESEPTASETPEKPAEDENEKQTKNQNTRKRGNFKGYRSRSESNEEFPIQSSKNPLETDEEEAITKLKPVVKNDEKAIEKKPGLQRRKALRLRQKQNFRLLASKGRAIRDSNEDSPFLSYLPSNDVPRRAKRSLADDFSDNLDFANRNNDQILENIARKPTKIDNKQHFFRNGLAKDVLDATELELSSFTESIHQPSSSSSFAIIDDISATSDTQSAVYTTPTDFTVLSSPSYGFDMTTLNDLTEKGFVRQERVVKSRRILDPSKTVFSPTTTQNKLSEPDFDPPRFVSRNITGIFSSEGYSTRVLRKDDFLSTSAPRKNQAPLGAAVPRDRKITFIRRINNAVPKQTTRKIDPIKSSLLLRKANTTSTSARIYNDLQASETGSYEIISDSEQTTVRNTLIFLKGPTPNANVLKVGDAEPVKFSRQSQTSYSGIDDKDIREMAKTLSHSLEMDDAGDSSQEELDEDYESVEMPDDEEEDEEDSFLSKLLTSMKKIFSNEEIDKVFESTTRKYVTIERPKVTTEHAQSDEKTNDEETTTKSQIVLLDKSYATIERTRGSNKTSDPVFLIEETKDVSENATIKTGVELETVSRGIEKKYSTISRTRPSQETFSGPIEREVEETPNPNSDEGAATRTYNPLSRTTSSPNSRTFEFTSKAEDNSKQFLMFPNTGSEEIATTDKTSSVAPTQPTIEEQQAPFSEVKNIDHRPNYTTVTRKKYPTTASPATSEETSPTDKDANQSLSHLRKVTTRSYEALNLRVTTERSSYVSAEGEDNENDSTYPSIRKTYVNLNRPRSTTESATQVTQDGKTSFVTTTSKISTLIVNNDSPTLSLQLNVDKNMVSLENTESSNSSSSVAMNTNVPGVVISPTSSAATKDNFVNEFVTPMDAISESAIELADSGELHLNAPKENSGVNQHVAIEDIEAMIISQRKQIASKANDSTLQTMSTQRSFNRERALYRSTTSSPSKTGLTNLLDSPNEGHDSAQKTFNSTTATSNSEDSQADNFSAKKPYKYLTRRRPVTSTESTLQSTDKATERERSPTRRRFSFNRPTKPTLTFSTDISTETNEFSSTRESLSGFRQFKVNRKPEEKEGSIQETVATRARFSSTRRAKPALSSSKTQSGSQVLDNEQTVFGDTTIAPLLGTTKRTYSNLNRLRASKPTDTTKVLESILSTQNQQRPGLVRGSLPTTVSAAAGKLEGEYNDEPEENFDEVHVKKSITQNYRTFQTSTTEKINSERALSEFSTSYSKLSFPTRKPAVLNFGSPNVDDGSSKNEKTFHEDQEDTIRFQVKASSGIFGEEINNSQQTQIPKSSLRPLSSLTSQPTGSPKIVPHHPSSNSTDTNSPALTATTTEHINTTNISVNSRSGNVLTSKPLVGVDILDDNYNNDDDVGNNTQPLLHVKVVDDDSVENSRPLLLNFNRRFQKISSRRRGGLDQVNSARNSSARNDQLANGSVATVSTTDAQNSSASTVSSRRRIAIYRVRRPLNNGTAVDSSGSNRRRTYEDSNVRIRDQNRTSTRLTQTSTTETPPTSRRQEIRRRLVRKRPVSNSSTAAPTTSSRRTTAGDDEKQNELVRERQFVSTTVATKTRRRKVLASTSTTERNEEEVKEEIARTTVDPADSAPKRRFRKVLRKIIRPGVNMTTVLPLLKAVSQDDGRIHLLKVGEISKNETKENEDSVTKVTTERKEETRSTTDQVPVTNVAPKIGDQISITKDGTQIDSNEPSAIQNSTASESSNAGSSDASTNATIAEITPVVAITSSTETNKSTEVSDVMNFVPKTNTSTKTYSSDTQAANKEPLISITESEVPNNVTDASSTSSGIAPFLNETSTDTSTTTTVATTKSKLYASRRPYKPTKPSILAITSTESTSPTPKSYVRKYSTNFTSIKLPTEIDNPVGIITPKAPAVLKQSSKRYRQKPTTARTSASQPDDEADEEEEYDDDIEPKEEEELDAPHKVALIKPNYVLINRTPKAESHLNENPVQGLDSEEDEDEDTYIEDERIKDLSRTNPNLPRPITSTILGQPASSMLSLGIPGVVPTANPLDLLQMVLLPSQLPSAAPAQSVNAESGAVVRLNNGFVGVLQKSESKEDEADTETTTLKTTSTRRQPPHRITRPSNKPRVVNRPFVTTIHPASLRLAVTNPPKPTTPAPFRPNSTRNYERKYTATSSTESTLSDNSLLEDLNIDALNARNKKIFEQASRKHTTVKPKTTQKDLNGAEYNTTNYNDTDFSSYDTTQLHQFNYNEEVLDANGINKFQESVLDHALHRPVTPASATSTTSKITTLHHVFELSEEDQPTTERLDSEEYFRIINNTVAKKLVEINRVVEVYSKQNVYKINISNHTTQNVSSTELKLEDLPRVDHIGEISRKALVNLVDASARSSSEESRSREHAGSNILIEGRSTVAGNRPLEEISATEFTPVRNSIPRYRSESTGRSGKSDQRPFIPDVLTGVETSTISLEGLFELTRQAKSERVVNSPVYATSLGEVRTSKNREAARSINSPEYVVTAKPSTPVIDFTLAPDSLALTGLESSTTEQSQRSETTLPPISTTERATTTIDRTSNYIRPPVPLLRPESNESSPLVISIANLDKVTLSKVPRDSSAATSGRVSTFVRPDGSALLSTSFNTDSDETVLQQEPHYNANKEPNRSQLRPNARRPVLSVRRRITPAASSNSTQDPAEPQRADTGSPATIGDSGSGVAGVTISSTSFTNRFNPRNRIRPATTTSTTEQPSVAPKVVIRRKFARPVSIIKRTSTTTATTTAKPSSSQAASDTDADQDAATEDVTSGNEARFTGGNIRTTNPLFRRRFSSTTPIPPTTPTSLHLELTNSPSVDQEIESSIQDTKFTNHRFNQIGENLEDEDNRKLVDAFKVMSNAPPPIGKEESNTRRTGLVKNTSNTISATAVPITTKRIAAQRPQKTTQATTVIPLTARPVVRRRKPQKPEPFEKVNSRQSAGRTYRPVLDYDYYDDDDVRFISKSNSQVKVVLHGRGLIECLDQGNFPHPLSCKKFISCAKMETGGVVGWEYTCPKGLSYDPVGGICNWSAGLGCKD